MNKTEKMTQAAGTMPAAAHHEVEAAAAAGEATAAQVQEWRRRWGKVYQVEITDGEERHLAYFHRPDLATIKAVTHLAKTDEVEAGRVMMDNCWIDGSPALRTDAVLFMAVQQQLAAIVGSCTGTLKNL